MKTREFELDKLAECRELQEKCRNAHMPIPPVLSWGYEVKDKNGNVTEKGVGKSNSFTRNAYNMMAFNVGLCEHGILNTTFADGTVNIKNTSGGIKTDGCYRNSGSSDGVVYLGTGTAETLGDYALPSYACNTVVSSYFDTSSRKLITNIIGTYTNNTGSTINFTEAGVSINANTGSWVTLMIHDIFDAVEVANGQTITWTYQTEVAYPNPA